MSTQTPASHSLESLHIAPNVVSPSVSATVGSDVLGPEVAPVVGVLVAAPVVGSPVVVSSPIVTPLDVRSVSDSLSVSPVDSVSSGLKQLIDKQLASDKAIRRMRRVWVFRRGVSRASAAQGQGSVRATVGYPEVPA